MRSTLATVVGWLLVALLVVWAFGFVIGTLRFVLRTVVWFVVLGGLLYAWLALKEPPKS